MSLFSVYVLIGLMFVLSDFTRAQELGICVKEQLKVLLHLNGNEPIGLTYCLLIFILLWPMILVLYYNDDDPTGHT